MIVDADLTPNDGLSTSQQVLHPGSRKLFRYWEGLRAERKCPTRPEFNLHQVRDLVSNLFILDYEPRSEIFRFKLSGTGINNLFRSELTGQDVLMGWDSFERGVIRQVLNIAQIQLQPALVRMRLFADLNQIIGAEALALPIRQTAGKDSGKIQLIGGLFPFTNPEQLAYNHIVDRQLVTSRTIWTEHTSGLMDAMQNNPAEALQPTASEKPRLRVIKGGLATETA